MLTLDLWSVLLAVVGPLALAGFWVGRRWYRARGQGKQPRPEPDTEAEAEGDPADRSEAAPVPPPQVPDELRAACREGNVVLFAGAGLAAGWGLPTHRELLSLMLDQLTDLPDDLAADLREQATVGDPAVLAEAVTPLLGPTRFHALLSTVLQAEQQYAREPRYLSPLADVPFAGVITTNLDTTLDRLFLDSEPVVIDGTGSIDDSARSALAGERFFLLKLFGDVRMGRPVAFGFRQLLMEAEGAGLPRFMTSLFARRTVLFLGCDLDEIEELFFSFRIRPGQHRHFAVVPALARGSSLLRERMSVRFGVTLLEHDVTAPQEQLEQFVRSLPIGGHSHAQSARKSPRFEALDEIVLRNIGPFVALRLPLTPQWNVLLGNNGCGKSTILRAIAFGMAGSGRDTEQWAASLLRAGASSGSIELRFGRRSYRTTLERDGNQVLARYEQITPVQAAAWLTLGFPALRGISAGNPPGPTTDSSPVPTVYDLLPLIDPVGLDRRMDRLKQWLVNISVSAELSKARRRGTAPARQREVFFDILRRLMPGPEFGYAGIDERTWDILVKTGDGIIPLDRLSQGMSSAIGWVGTVVQRLYEVHSEHPRPERRPALVLVDEIDAHLHPEWQARIVPTLREVLPGIQVVASTHSPLVVGNLQTGELNHLRREHGPGVTVERIDQSFRGWRADQILTGPAFDLESSRDPATAVLMQEYRALLAKQDPTAAERARIQQLADQLESELPSHQETETSRRAEWLVEEWMLDRLRDLTSDEQERVMQEAQLYLARLRPVRP